jgi:hypothetical protein
VGLAEELSVIDMPIAGDRSTKVAVIGTAVPFSNWCVGLNVLLEQFWGRAARAPCSSQELQGARHLA